MWAAGRRRRPHRLRAPAAGDRPSALLRDLRTQAARPGAPAQLASRVRQVWTGSAGALSPATGSSSCPRLARPLWSTSGASGGNDRSHRPAGRATLAVVRSGPGGRLEPMSRPPAGPTVARFSDLTVGVAQLVELLVVVQAVGGSSPLAHPLRKASISGAFLLVGDAGWLVRRRRCTTSLYHLAAFGCVDDIPSFPATTRAGWWRVPPRRQGRAFGLRCAHRNAAP